MSDDLYAPTHYLESNALLAVQAELTDDAQEILAKMLPGERQRLAEACLTLARMIRDTCFVCSEPITDTDRTTTAGLGRAHERCDAVAQLTRLERRLR